MSKIYEAMQNVYRERKQGGETVRQSPMPFASLQPARFGFEDEMLRLYKVVETLLPHNGCRIIQFISAREGEGTSTISREFAKVGADLIGHSVLLVDADRLNQSQDRFFGLPGGMDWVEALKSGKNIEECFQRAGQSKLFVSGCSNSSVSTPEIFNSAFEMMCEKLRVSFELVLIDSAPLAVSPDGLAIASKVDGVVLVVEAERSRWQTTKRLRDNIERVGGNILGVVLNKRRFYIPQSIYRFL
jgi:Mrp family chromosome partitioning ATPase